MHHYIPKITLKMSAKYCVLNQDIFSSGAYWGDNEYSCIKILTMMFRASKRLGQRLKLRYIKSGPTWCSKAVI